MSKRITVRRCELPARHERALSEAIRAAFDLES
jgi:hypothetical protein